MVSLTDGYGSSQKWSKNDFSKMKPSVNSTRNAYNSTDAYDYYLSSNQALFEAIKVQKYREQLGSKKLNSQYLNRQTVLLLQSGISTNGRNELGETPLIFVAKNFGKKDNKRSREKFAKILLDFGADPNMQDDDGRTALMHATSRGEIDLVNLLLNCERTDVTTRDREGNTAVMYAINYGSSALLRTFIENFVVYRIDPNFLRQRNIYGKTALEMAKEMGKSDCVIMLTKFVTNNYDLPQEWRTINTTDSKSTLDSESSPVKPDTRPLTRRKANSEKRKDNQRSAEEKELKKKSELFKSRNGSHSKTDAFHEIWEQETRNWFNGERESSKTANGTKTGKDSASSLDKEEEFKLPPINGSKLIDYKTWCEIGEQRRGSNFIIQNPS